MLIVHFQHFASSNPAKDFRNGVVKRRSAIFWIRANRTEIIIGKVGSTDCGAHLHQSAMDKPMGIWVEDDNSFTLSAGYQIMRFKNGLEPDQRVNQQFDACFVPRETYFTGELDAHDIGIDGNGRPIFINTRFNCLAATDPRHSFREVWRPPFISALVDEDRCHLNGLAMDNGEAAYVTAVSRSDTIDGWRDRRDNGGVVIDVRSNKIVCEGLSMPHSPRLHNGELWILNSGTGELGVVEGAAKGKGKFVPRVFCPGFARGLTIQNSCPLWAYPSRATSALKVSRTTRS